MTEAREASICRLVHEVPGRIRLKSARRLPIQEREGLERRLARSEAALEVEIRPVSRSIILRFDERAISRDSLLAEVEQALQRAGAEGGETPPEAAGGPSRQDHKPSLRTPRGLLVHGATALILSGVLLFSLWMRVVRRRPLPQNLLSLTGVVAVVGSVPLFLRAWKEWRAGRPMGLFPALGTSSLLALLAGAASTAFNIIWTLSLGMFLEELVMEKARRDVRKLVETAPQTARVLERGRTVEKRVVDIRIGEIAVICSGWAIPADGVVVSGQALINESQITGHQFPALRGSGEWVFGGTSVLEGSVQVEVKRSGRDTYLSSVLDLVEQALDSRSAAERKADLLAGRMVKIGAVSTLGTFLLTRNPSSTLAVLLVMSCPCATILAASTALTATIAAAARRNILIKSGAALESMEGANCVCFDKTGTLTLQLPELAGIRTRSPWIAEERLLALAAGVEAFSQHPIAGTVVREARKKVVQPDEVAEAEVVLGRGVRGRVRDQEVLVGSGAFLQEQGVDIGYFKNVAAEQTALGRTPVYVAKAGKTQGMLLLESSAQPESAEVLDALRRAGIRKLCLMSGDEASLVQALCASLPFDECRGALKPEDKTVWIGQLQAQGFRVCMVGDGVNDALALSAADLGLAVGAGVSDAALEAADIVLMGDNLKDIAVLRRLSQRCLQVIDQNFWIGTGSDSVGLGLALTGVLTPLLGGAIHVGHTLAILLNSSRLLRWQDGAGSGLPQAAPVSSL